jgi:DNA ligase-4
MLYRCSTVLTLTIHTSSKILQIKAAQITVTDKYKSGYTLRFPRVMKIRTDKNWDMCMTIQELIDMATNFEGRYAKRKFSESTGAKDTKSPAKKKKVTSVEIRNPAAVVLPSFRPIDPRTVEVKSDLFKNLEFFVVSGDFKHPKVMLQTLIMMHGGTTIQTPTQRTYCVIAGDESTIHTPCLGDAGLTIVCPS